jgi:hypothetical protein
MCPVYIACCPVSLASLGGLDASDGRPFRSAHGGVFERPEQLGNGTSTAPAVLVETGESFEPLALRRASEAVPV